MQKHDILALAAGALIVVGIGASTAKYINARAAERMALQTMPPAQAANPTPSMFDGYPTYQLIIQTKTGDEFVADEGMSLEDCTEQMIPGSSECILDRVSDPSIIERNEQFAHR